MGVVFICGNPTAGNRCMDGKPYRLNAENENEGFLALDFLGRFNGGLGNELVIIWDYKADNMRGCFNMEKNKQPVFLMPAFKDYLWGGTRLKTEYNKKTELDKVAESWELSTHKDGESVIRSGKYAGEKLSEYIQKNPYDVLGKRAKAFDFFPILIKFIDAKQSLSVQVHPDDEYSLAKNGEYGKTEMWYILDCDDGAELYYGFRDKITKEEFRQSIENNTLLEKLNSVKVKKGDVYFIVY